MFSKKSDTLPKSGSTVTVRRHLTLIGGLIALTLLVAGKQADAQVVHFRYNGGAWSHSYHVGWNRYWGGPSIGFYFAPAPVYVVPGYVGPSYYTGPDFWYSNPSFGLSLNFGGGGYYGGGYYAGRGAFYSGPRSGYHGGGYYGGGYHGSGYHGSFHGGGRYHR